MLRTIMYGLSKVWWMRHERRRSVAVMTLTQFRRVVSSLKN